MIDGQARNCYEQAVKALENQDMVGALAWLTQAITLSEDYADALLLRGRLLRMMGDSKGAEADLRRLLQIKPDMLNDLTGNYVADGKEEGPRKKHSNLNPYGL